MSGSSSQPAWAPGPRCARAAPKHLWFLNHFLSRCTLSSLKCVAAMMLFSSGLDANRPRCWGGKVIQHSILFFFLFNLLLLFTLGGSFKEDGKPMTLVTACPALDVAGADASEEQHWRFLNSSLELCAGLCLQLGFGACRLLPTAPPPAQGVLPWERCHTSPVPKRQRGEVR